MSKRITSFLKIIITGRYDDLQEFDDPSDPKFFAAAPEHKCPVYEEEEAEEADDVSQHTVSRYLQLLVSIHSG